MSHVFHILFFKIVSVVLTIIDVTILMISFFEEKDSRHDNMTNIRDQSSSQEFDDELEILEIQQVDSR